MGRDDGCGTLMKRTTKERKQQANNNETMILMLGSYIHSVGRLYLRLYLEDSEAAGQEHYSRHQLLQA